MSDNQYKIIGSITSPFVRRTRLLLWPLGHEFVSINYTEKADSDFLKGLGPINKIPILYDRDMVIYDSRVIFNYINKKHQLFEFGREEENFLSIIDAGLDSQVQMFMMKRSGININQAGQYFERNHDRITDVLSYLEKMMNHTTFSKWEYVSMALYSWLDWALFREQISLDGRPGLISFMDQYSQRADVLETSPRIQA